ncbi:hypothetical protein EES40_29795 [Streptomyces sp. ADI93-02]|nr:hypothetical protein EES40_29795 [Streptomyces sp. ADI93-02]
MGSGLFADSPAARGTSARPAASGAFERSSLARLMGGGSATRLRAVLPARGPRDRCRRRVHRPVGPFRVLPIHGSGQGGTPCPRVRGWCGCPGRRTSARGRGRRARRSGRPFRAVRRRGRGDPPDRWSRSDPWCGPHCRATAHRRGSAVPLVRRAVLHRAYEGGSGSRDHGRASVAGHAEHCSGEQSEQVRHVRGVTHERLLADRACPLRHVDWWNRSHWCGLTLERQVVSVNTPVLISRYRNNSTLQVS